MLRADSLYLRLVHRLLPSPFTIAVLLTVLTFVLAATLTQPTEANPGPYWLTLAGYWQKGFWELLAFTMQMVLILVLGHTLALSPAVNRLIGLLAQQCRTTAQAALIVSAASIAVSFVNWGLCLIFGAILARKVGQAAAGRGRQLNYPLIGAAGYAGMMCWHGGFSGSAPLKVAEANHFLVAQTGQISIAQTLLSPLNITTALALIVLIPALFYWMGRKSTTAAPLPATTWHEFTEAGAPLGGAERLDRSPWLGRPLGLVIAALGLVAIFTAPAGQGLGLVNLNWINFMLFGLALAAHGTVHRFLAAVEAAVKGATGIIIQFPLYAGIMGIMKYSGLIVVFADAFVAISNSTTFPLFTLLSAGLVNTFVPSGGGQWLVQGPVVIEAANQLGVPHYKAVMALAYGDQLTNMLQPFWALPLLGITQLKAKAILPYSFIVMLAGLFIFTVMLLVF